MKLFLVDILIHAAPERIWTLLTDAAHYPAWNKTVDRIEGDIALGQRITVRTRMNPGRAFPVKVVEFTPAKSMVWAGGLPLGLFKGTRTFTLSPRPDGQVQFMMREEFTGVLSPLIARSIPDLQPMFAEFADCLKQAAEKV